MWWSLARLLLVFLLPSLLGRCVRLIRGVYNWRSHVVFLRKLSPGELVLLALLGAVTLRCWANVLAPRPNFFALTGTDLGSPAFMIRNNFRSYIERRSQKKPAFAAMLTERDEKLAKEGVKTKGPVTGYHKLEQEFIKLEQLAKKLSSYAARRSYILFGEDILNCQEGICGDEGDIWRNLMYIIPGILKDYLQVLIPIGLLSEFPLKRSWRMSAGTGIGLLMAIEGLQWVFTEGLEVALFDILFSDPYMTKYERMAYSRSLILGTISFLVLLVDLAPGVDMAQETLQKSVNVLESSISKLHTARLARMTAMQDDSLRRHFWDFYRRADQERQHLFNDPEYKKIMANVAKKYNMEEMVTSATDSIDRIFSTAHAHQD